VVQHADTAFEKTMLNSSISGRTDDNFAMSVTMHAGCYHLRSSCGVNVEAGTGSIIAHGEYSPAGP
jgi:hypothetical protein